MSPLFVSMWAQIIQQQFIVLKRRLLIKSVSFYDILVLTGNELILRTNEADINKEYMSMFCHYRFLLLVSLQ